MSHRISPLKVLANVALLMCTMAFCIPMATPQVGVDSPMPVTLDSMRDRYRPVLVFAPSTTPDFLNQIRILAQGGVPLHERNVITVPLLLHQDNKPWGIVFNGNDDIGQMAHDEQAAARRRFHIAPSSFTVILLGKDGGEKLRSTKPLTLQKLRDTIDAMPMRQEEMRARPTPPPS
jgi:hypothetical protein